MTLHPIWEHFSHTSDNAPGSFKNPYFKGQLISCQEPSGCRQAVP